MENKNDTIGTRDPLVIANYFISKGKDHGKFFTPLQLIKLVYIAHGWFLAFFKKPLLREPVQAWKYGPVVPSVYHAAKKYGGASVTELLAGAGNPNEILDAQEKELLDEVLKKYGHYSGIELSSITHKKGTPWQETWNGRFFQDIPDKLIEAYYLAMKESSQ